MIQCTAACAIKRTANKGINHTHKQVADLVEELMAAAKKTTLLPASGAAALAGGGIRCRDVRSLGPFEV